ncbi:MAG: hypothetical protein JSU68_04870 [Phycisphaerales bacterium]|nr:MAG: hypothetical protein JSU68_04870 [Phycisphaerales bacterium]
MPVVVYQMGKVGSISVLAALQDCGCNPLHHVHVLNPRYMRPGTAHDPEHEKAARAVYSNIVERRRPAKFITLAREPIGRCVSAFFQAENFRAYAGRPLVEAEWSLEQLAQLFGTRLTHMAFFALTWFDRQIGEVLGIDVFAEPFPHKAGFAWCRQGPFELIVLRSELDDSLKERALRDFLGLDELRMRRANVGEEKDHARLYRRFRDSARLPDSYVERLLGSRYARHFYTQQEIERLRAQWTEAGRDLPIPADNPGRLDGL